jgi:hypothetical protein
MNIKRLCPFCAGEILLEVSICPHCERNLQVMKAANSQPQPDAALYQVVPDGLHFGISIAGEVKLHGLELKEAHDLAALLNRVTEVYKAG